MYLCQAIMLAEHPWIIAVFFLIATLYSAAGFGGGSGYLALLSQLSSEQLLIRTAAYICNIVVTGTNSLRHQKFKWFSWKETWPWIVLAVPCSFLGGTVAMGNDAYLLLLGGVLLVAAVLLMLRPTPSNQTSGALNKTWVQLGMGGMIGFLAGVVGIGGGIFLSPLLHLTNWRSPERIASVSSVFILVNALAGGTGSVLSNGMGDDYSLYFFLSLAVLGGALLGTKFSFSERGRRRIRFITGVLVLLVGLRLLWQNG